MRVTAVVVTYNRLELLKECLAALQNQSVAPNDIVVINNNSTDGTSEWLQECGAVTSFNFPNRGGAWGFHEGIKKAYATGADWVWVMDDDTIANPNALEKLLEAVNLSENQAVNFGFFGSRVLWTDGKPHLLNVQREIPGNPGHSPHLSSKRINSVAYNSFVSLLVSRKAIKAAGLPIKEFFIWNDDIEFTMRILKKGFSGAVVTDSIVIHKTAANNSSDIYTDSIRNVGKHRYGMRNALYIRRHHKSYSSYFTNLLKNFLLLPLKILFRRKNGKAGFVRAAWKGTAGAIGFNPRIEFVED